MSEPSLFLRILMGLELLAFVVVIGCCSAGINHTKNAMLRTLRGLNTANGRPADNFRWPNAEERRRNRAAIRPYMQEFYFWGFFLVLGVVMFITFAETLPS